MHSPSAFPLPPRTFDGSCRQVEPGAPFQWLQQAISFIQSRPLPWLGMAVLLLTDMLAGLWLPKPFGLLAVLPLPLLLASAALICREQADERQLLSGKILLELHTHLRGLMTIGLLLTLLLASVVWSGSAIAGNVRGPLASLFSGIWIALLAIPILLANAFAPMLTLFHETPPARAMKASANACLCNALPLLVFFLLCILLTLLVLLSAGLAFFIVAPLVGATFFAAYRDIFPGT